MRPYCRWLDDLESWVKNCSIDHNRCQQNAHNPVGPENGQLDSVVGLRFCNIGSCCPLNFEFPGEMKQNQTAIDQSVAALPIDLDCRTVAAEFIGTFILLFGCAGAAMMNVATDGQVTYVGVGAAAGMAVMLVIFSTGHISGAHVNPAVTIAFATFKHFAWIQVPLYIGAQVGGSIVASYVLKVIFTQYYRGGLTLPSGSVWQSLAVELILTFILMFVVTAVSTDTRAVGELAGIAVGVTVVLNNVVGGAISGASMNPVRSLGPAVAALEFSGLWVYIVAPILGALAGATAYTCTRLEP